MKLLSIFVLAMFGLFSYGKEDSPSTLSETREEQWAARDRARAERWAADRKARDEEWAADRKARDEEWAADRKARDEEWAAVWKSDEQTEERRTVTAAERERWSKIQKIIRGERVSVLESHSPSDPPVELTIREAEANLEEVQRVYAEAKVSKSEAEIAEARKDVKEALRILNITYERPAYLLLSRSLTNTIAPIAKSRAEVAKAEANFEEAKASKSEEEITLAERALRKAQVELTISEEYVLLKKAQYDKLGNENRARASINVILARRYVQDAIRIRHLILEQESLEAAGTNNCAVCDNDTVQVGRHAYTADLVDLVLPDDGDDSSSVSSGSGSSGSR